MQFDRNLEALLQAREQRWQLRQSLAQSGQSAILSATLRLPHALRQSDEGQAIFDLLCARFEALLIPEGGSLLMQTLDADGPAWHYAVPDARQAKRLAIRFEEQETGGDLIDLDVIDARGQPLSRAALGALPRACLVCGARPAAACVAAERHSREDTQAAFEARIRALPGDPNDRIARCALRALLYEAAAAPKPGLVDRFSSGVHRDMDFYSFIDSALSLQPYFRQCARIGGRARIAPEKLLEVLRPLGLEAEQTMFRATRGANTHKGMIFSMGILCAASARVHPDVSPEAIGAMAARIAMPALDDAMTDSHGDRARRLYGTLGARGEAAAGFPSARAVLPLFQEALANGADMDAAARLALYHLMAELGDTNVLHRAGEGGLSFMQQGAQELISEGLPQAGCAAFERELERRGISPGGCADSLALTLFLHLLSAEI